MISFYILSEGFPLKCKGWSDARQISFAKIQKPLKPRSDEQWNAICRNCRLFGICVIEKIQFSLTYFGT